MWSRICLVHLRIDRNGAEACSKCQINPSLSCILHSRPFLFQMNEIRKQSVNFPHRWVEMQLDWVCMSLSSVFVVGVSHAIRNKSLLRFCGWLTILDWSFTSNHLIHNQCNVVDNYLLMSQSQSMVKDMKMEPHNLMLKLTSCTECMSASWNFLMSHFSILHTSNR